MTRNGSGKLIVDKDHPIYQIWHGKDERGKAVTNKLSGLLQEYGEAGEFKNFAVDPTTPSNVFDQLLQQSPKLAGVVMSELSKLSPMKRTAVLGSMNSLLDMYGLAGGTLIKAQKEHVGARLGRILQTIQPNLDYKTAIAQSRGLLEAVQNRDPGMLAQATLGIPPERVQYFTEIATQLAQPVLSLQQDILSRPWFMSEQRPGKWMVESTAKDGTREMDGAESQSHAELIAKQLKIERARRIEQRRGFDQTHPCARPLL